MAERNDNTGVNTSGDSGSQSGGVRLVEAVNGFQQMQAPTGLVPEAVAGHEKYFATKQPQSGGRPSWPSSWLSDWLTGWQGIAALLLVGLFFVSVRNVWWPGELVDQHLAGGSQQSHQTEASTIGEGPPSKAPNPPLQSTGQAVSLTTLAGLRMQPPAQTKPNTQAGSISSLASLTSLSAAGIRLSR